MCLRVGGIPHYTQLTLYSSTDIQTCIRPLFNCTGTFDVQNVTIVPKRDGQYEITCVFAPGSQSKGCRIGIMPEGGGGDCELNITVWFKVFLTCSK